MSYLDFTENKLNTSLYGLLYCIVVLLKTRAKNSKILQSFFS